MKNITRTQYQAFPYHLVDPSPWPILSSFAMLTLTVSAVLYFHGFVNGGELLILGFILVAGGMSLWFRDVIIEGTKKIKTIMATTKALPGDWISLLLLITLLYLICYILLGLDNYSTNFIQYDCSTTMGKFAVNFLLFSSLLPVKPDESLSSKRLTRLERQQISLPDNLKQISFGLLLGDLCSEKPNETRNARLIFGQGILHQEYFLHVYGLFKEFCSAKGPYTSNNKPDKRTGKIYNMMSFKTLSLPCFNELHNRFYPSGKKVVPLDANSLLTPLGLCYWLSDDATFDKTNSVVVICTDSFSLEEVELLVKTLNDKWSLNCYIKKITKTKSGYRITIPRKSLPVLQSLLKDIMPPMMLYKIGL